MPKIERDCSQRHKDTPDEGRYPSRHLWSVLDFSLCLRASVRKKEDRTRSILVFSFKEMVAHRDTETRRRGTSSLEPFIERPLPVSVSPWLREKKSRGLRPQPNP